MHTRPPTAPHARPPTVRPERRRTHAALTLACLTTLCAELTFTAVAVPKAWLLLPLLVVMYGAGVLVIREAVVRVGVGWPGLVLLALAYQVAEDGLGLQALTSPEMYDVTDWSVRSLGVNWSYWESQIGVHVALSVLLPVMLANLLFPELRDRPYLGGRGLLVAGALAVVGVLGLRGLVSATEDPGYRTPWGWTVAYVLVIAVLAWLALRVLPRYRGSGRVHGRRRAPRPVVVGAVSGYLTTAFLTTLMPFGLGDDMLMGDLMSTESRLLVGAMTAVPFAWVVARWRGSADWSDAHRLWLAGGILVSHTAFMMPASLASVFLGLGTIVLEVVLLVALARRVRRRSPVPEPRRG
ncbi:hypothetical protein SAMN06297387_1369 [Streptomyces zhaozhouensis]|uniref:Uncharacterized protein n=1 Tax=Streptomyces zhaozhouensis TaxID=1300267 RepID=A0A286EAB0_9ACTN|nr:hypothetical protein [Streptomyces zhaozhouensis]SOD67828.1 hypothetical protein SAMN06297387_1369 [Streptomyces zhaozhouensis]